MSFIFSQVNPSKTGNAATPFGAGDFYGAALDEGIHSQTFESIWRMSEYHLAGDFDEETNPLLPTAEANHQAQQAGLDLKFSIDPTLDEFNLLMNRKIAERDRQTILSSGADNIMRSAGAMGVGFLGSLLNPLDLGLMFLPVVGEAAKAEAVGAKFAGVGGKIAAGLERGLVTEEQLAKAGIAFKGYTAAAVTGSVGMATIEIPRFLAAKEDQTKFSSDEFFTNVALGGLFGIGMHGLGQIFKAALKAHGKLTPETHENMGVAATEDFLNGDVIDPVRVAHLDDHVNEIAASDSDFSDMTAKADLSDPTARLTEQGIIREKLKWDEPQDVKLVAATLTLEDRRVFTGVTHATAYNNALDAGITEAQLETAYPGFLNKEGKVVTRDNAVINNEGKGLAEDFKFNETALEPATPESKTKVANEQLESYRSHEEAKATEVSKQRDQEIAGSRTLEDPTVHTYTGEVSELDAEIAKIDSEIDELKSELEDFEDAGDFELDPRISGDVANIAPHLGNRTLFGTLDQYPILKDLNAFSIWGKDLQELMVDMVEGETIQLRGGVKGEVVIDPRMLVGLRAHDKQLIVDLHNFMFEHTQHESGLFKKNGKLDNNHLDEHLEFEGEYGVLQDLVVTNPKIGQELTDIFVRFQTRNPKKFSEAMDNMGFLLLNANKYKGKFIPVSQALDNSAYVGVDTPTLDLGITLPGLPEPAITGTWWEGAIEEFKGQILTVTDEGRFREKGTYVAINEKFIRSSRQVLTDPDFIMRPNNLRKKYSFINNILETASDKLTPKQIEILNEIKMLIEIDPDVGKIDFANIKNFDRIIPLDIWKSALPKLEPNAKPEWKAGDFTFAAEQLIPELEPLFKELYALDPTLKDVSIEFNEKLLSEEGAAGMYRGSKDRIEISTEHATAETIVHEMIHASAVKRLRKDINSVSTERILETEGERYLLNLQRYAKASKNEGFKEIVEAYLRTLEHHATKTGDRSAITNANILWEDFQIKTNEPQYGLLNLDEFISEGLSNRSFQKYLNGIQAGKQTMFTKFMNAIKNVFDLGVKKIEGSSVLDQLLSGYEKALKQEPSRAGELVDNLPRATVDDINKNVLAQVSNCLLL